MQTPYQQHHSNEYLTARAKVTFFSGSDTDQNWVGRDYLANTCEVIKDAFLMNHTVGLCLLDV